MASSAANHPPDPDDLLSAVGRGDRDAFALLYDTLAPAVYGMARRVARSDAIAEEITQEVMLEVWRTAGRFDASRGSARAYVLTLAHRRAVDRVRSEEASRTRAERVGARQAVRPFDVVSEAAERSWGRTRVVKALEKLTDLQRQAIELAYFDGLSQSQIAEALSLPLGTVKTRMRDGMIRLSSELGHLR